MTCPEPFHEEDGECLLTVQVEEVANYEGSVMKNEPKNEPVVSTVGQPDAFLPGVSEVLAKDGAISGMTVVLVGLVLASGLALKLVPNWLDHKAKLAQSSNKKPGCANQHLALEEQVRELARAFSESEERATIRDARLTALEQKEEPHES